MSRRTLLSLALLSMLTAACGGGEAEPATDSGAESAAASAPQAAVGRCAVDCPS